MKKECLENKRAIINTSVIFFKLDKSQAPKQKGDSITLSPFLCIEFIQPEPK